MPRITVWTRQMSPAFTPCERDVKHGERLFSVIDVVVDVVVDDHIGDAERTPVTLALDGRSRVQRMHVGLSVIFQNPGRARPDHEVYAADLRLARQAEPLGFDSIWSVEHHFTDYTMCPDVMQFLTYMAGCTETIQLGSMVCVLPWHDPLRVVEQISMLDTLSEGRLVLGIGRGTGRVEFDGFGVEMPEARGRFAESAEMILTALDTGVAEYDGQYVRQPRVEASARA